MKRLIVRAAVALLALSLLLTAGCSSKPKELDLDAFCAKVMETVAYDDELVELSDNNVGDFYAIPFEGLEDYAIFASGTMATTNELVVMKLKDEAAVAQAKKVVEQRIADQVASYGNYRPEELDRLKKAVTEVKGNYLLLTVSPDNDAIVKLFTDSLK